MSIQQLHWNAGRNVKVFNLRQTYTHTYIYIYIYMDGKKEKTVFTFVFLTNKLMQAESCGRNVDEQIDFVELIVAY